MKRRTLVIVAGLIVGGIFVMGRGALALAPSTSIADHQNRHNLSAYGPGVEGGGGVVEERICVFCHTPHHATSVTPLWGRDLSEATYIPYESSTLKATPGQPTGASRLCLGCHDGTIALGMLSGGRQVIGLAATMMPVASNLSTDLSDDHPISFDYAASAVPGSGFRPIGDLTPLLVLDDDRVECNACHDPHRDLYPPADKPLETGKFLRINNSQFSRLCTSCHIRAGLTEGAHYTEIEACEKCHSTHKAPKAARLLRAPTEQDTCLVLCHNETPPPPGKGVDIKGTFTYPLAHTQNVVPQTGSHDANENPRDFISSEVHVECVDCHNPCLTKHETTPLSVPPAINGRLVNVLISKDDSGVKTFATTEYDICFKCHSDQPFVPAAVPRLIQSGNMAYRFDLNNPSFHPVLGPRSSDHVPSLRTEIMGFDPQRLLNTSSMLYCTDCHNSNNATKAGGTGPSGPHGSDVSHILVDGYSQIIQDPPFFTDDLYALCFRCHVTEVIIDATKTLSAFPEHYSHIVTEGISCSICHDPHGVPTVLGGTTAANTQLINFDTNYVTFGTFNASVTPRTCTVSCHSANPRSYFPNH